MTPDEFPDNAAYQAYILKCEETLYPDSRGLDDGMFSLSNYDSKYCPINGLKYYYSPGAYAPTVDYHTQPMFTVKTDDHDDSDSCYWCHPEMYFNQNDLVLYKCSTAEELFWKHIRGDRDKMEREYCFGEGLDYTLSERVSHP